MTYFKRSVAVVPTASSTTTTVNGFSNYFGTLMDFSGTTNYGALGIRRRYQNNDNTLNAIYQVNLVPDTTYRFISTLYKNTDAAVGTFTIEDADTGEVYATHTEDTYTASATYVGYSFTFTFTPADSVSRSTVRSCYIRLTNATKNASSSGYFLTPFVNFFCLHWTATTNTLIHPANSRSLVKWEVLNTTYSSGTDSVSVANDSWHQYDPFVGSQTRYIDLPMIVGKSYKFTMDTYGANDRGKMQTIIKDSTGTTTLHTLAVIDTYSLSSNQAQTDSETFTFQPSGYDNDTVLTTRWFLDNTLTPTGSLQQILFVTCGFSLQQLS